MKHCLILSVLLLSTAAANAADLAAPQSAPEAPVAMPFSWSGFYAGAFVGYDQSQIKSSNALFEGIDAGLPAYTVKPAGLALGGDIGFNQQYGSMVLGVEGDFSWLNAKKSDSRFIDTFAFTTESSVDWLATARGRVGYAMDRALFYATGGLAAGRVVNTIHDIYTPDPTITTSVSKVQFGWTVGLGVEYAFTDNLSMKLDYLYYDLGKKNGSYDEGSAGWSPITVDLKTTGSLIRTGLNYRF